MNSRDFNINCKLFRNSGCWVMLVLLCVLLAGCESKHNAVYELHLFRENIQKHGSKYSQMEWEQAIEEYADICKRLDEMPLTDEERMEIDKVKGEIAGHATTIAAQDISDKIQTIANEIESFAEGFNKFLLNLQLDSRFLVHNSTGRRALSWEWQGNQRRAE